MTLLSGIFKAYDIRGVVPDELTPDLAYDIGRAFSAYIRGGTIAVGRDMRVSSEAISQALIRGLTQQGSLVVDLGLITTDMVYFACGKYGYDGGVMITASHNPGQYNGLKLCGKAALPISKTTGLSDLQAMIEQANFPPPGPTGQVTTRDIAEAWIEHALSFIDRDKIKPLRVVIDAGNGMAGYIIPLLAKHLPLEIIPLYFELDGTFPNHPASPIEPENMADLQAKVRETKADLGLAFDGDADRVFLTDELGNILSGTLMTAMIAKNILDKTPQATILYNAICGDIVPETVLAHQGTAIRTQVGHSIIKKDMRTYDAVFAGEHSGHYYFRDNYYADSGLIAALIMLELIGNDERPLSDIVREFDKYPSSGEINFHLNDIPAKLAELKNTFQDAQIDELDGLTIRYPTWWCNIRPSNTEPLLRLNIEARDQPTLATQTDRFRLLLQS